MRQFTREKRLRIIKTRYENDIIYELKNKKETEKIVKENKENIKNNKRERLHKKENYGQKNHFFGH